MGVWGPHFDQNDDHFNDGSLVLEAGIKELHRIVVTNLNNGKFPDGSGTWTTPIHSEIYTTGRSLLVTTTRAMKGSGITSFLPESIEQLKEASSIVRQSTEAIRDTFINDPKKMLDVANKELDEVDEYLNGFDGAGFLEDRLGSILEATAEKGL